MMLIEQYERDNSLVPTAWFPYSSRIDYYCILYAPLFDNESDISLYFG